MIPNTEELNRTNKEVKVPVGVIKPSLTHTIIMEQGKALSSMIQTGFNLYNSNGEIVPLELAGTGLSLFVTKTKGGKTAILTSLASLLMMEQKKTIIYITTEEPSSSIYARILTATAGYKKGSAVNDSYLQVQQGIERRSYSDEVFQADKDIEREGRLFIVEGFGTNQDGEKYQQVETIIKTIKPFAKELEQVNGEKPIVIIDYMQRMKTATRTNGKTEELGIVIDRIIEEFNRDFPILSVAQITRTATTEALRDKAKKPWQKILSQDIGESKELENGATGIFLIWKLEDDKDKAIIKILDHRYCESGSIGLFDVVWKNSCFAPNPENRRKPLPEPLPKKTTTETTKEEPKEATPPKEEKGKVKESNKDKIERYKALQHKQEEGEE